MRCVRRTHGGRIGRRVVAVVGNRVRLRTASVLSKGAARESVRLGIHHAQNPDVRVISKLCKVR